MPSQKNRSLAAWLTQALADSTGRFRIVLPAISDYELRRKLLHLSRYRRLKEAKESLQRLDELVEYLEYLPLDAETMWRAANLWADARGRGTSTSADRALDGDVILAAQALEVDGAVLTTNTKHLSQFVPAHYWEELV